MPCICHASRFRLTASRWVRLPHVRRYRVSGNVALELAGSGAVGHLVWHWIFGSPRIREVASWHFVSKTTSWHLEVDGAVVATARFSQDAAADSNRAWIVSTCPARLLGRDQAITALTVAQLLEGGYLDEHPLVAALRKELRCPTALIRVTTAHTRACHRSFADQVVLGRQPRPCGGAHPGARGPARPRYVSAFMWCDNGVVRCPAGRLSAPVP